MDFVRSHFGKMKLWPVEHFWLTFFPDQHWSEWSEHWSEFHFSEVTSYKIHTVAEIIKGISFLFEKRSVQIVIINHSCELFVSLPSASNSLKFYSNIVFLTIGQFFKAYLNNLACKTRSHIHKLLLVHRLLVHCSFGQHSTQLFKQSI